MKQRFFGMIAGALLTVAICGGQTISTYFVGGTSGLAVDAQGTVYYTESSTSTVYKISGGIATKIAGNGNFGYAGDGGPALNATLFMSSGTSGVAVDSAGNVYFTDGYNNVIRKINKATGIITTYAGNGTGAGTGFGGFAGDNGPATGAQLSIPTDIALDANGNLYICDTSNSRVRKVTPQGIITTFAGNGNVAYEGDNVQAASTAVPSPNGITVDSQGNVYIASDRRVRKVDAVTGIITTYAGNGVRAFAGDGGPATSASIRGAVGLGVDQFGNLFLADTSNATTGTRIRKVDATGIITSYAGIDGNSSTALGDGGPATSAYLGTVGDLMVDSSNNVYVSTGGGTGRIRKITAAGAGFGASPSSLSFSYAIGGSNPASQTLSITSTGGVLGYTTSSSSTGNWLSVTPGSGSTPGTLTVSVNPVGLGGGQTYQGTILLTPTVAGNSPLSINVTLTVTGSGAPTISTTGGIVNATGYQAKLAPGTVFAIFGSNLGPTSIVVASPPSYPLSLSGTSVTLTPLGGNTAVQARIYYSLNVAVAAILPSSIAPGTYNLTVKYNSLTSAPQQVTVVARSFGIAAASGYGAGIAQATDANINGGASLTRLTAGSAPGPGFTWTLTPAHPGDTITLWGTGGGAEPDNDLGSGSPKDRTADGNFIVNVGSRQVVPAYTAAVLGYPGLWQINVQLPSDIAIDCFTTISVTTGSETGNTVVVPIAAAGQTSCIDPNTPASILSKIDSGSNITVGPFSISRVTDALANSTSEAASGGVFNYTPVEWTIQNSGPVFGACRLYDRTYPQNGRDPATPESTLNAGTKLTLTGQNLAPGFGLDIVPLTLGPFYSSAALTTGTFANSSYTLGGTGGADVGPFSSTTVFPASFTATNFSSITSINRSQPLTFTWTGSGIDTVAILLSSSLTAGGVIHITTINCSVPSGPGSYTVPTAALATLLPAGVTGSNFGVVSITGANTQGKYTANFTKGSQLDLGTFTSLIGVQKHIAVQ